MKSGLDKAFSIFTDYVGEEIGERAGSKIFSEIMKSFE